MVHASRDVRNIVVKGARLFPAIGVVQIAVWEALLAAERYMLVQLVTIYFEMTDDPSNPCTTPTEC